jgi:hypothetical protein
MFTPSEAKRQLRVLWDAPIIGAIADGVIRGPLNYFGLPGPSLEDIRDWKANIGIVLALEKERDDAATLTSNAMVLGLQKKGFQLVLGDLDDFIHVATRDGNTILRKTWYHLLNLDYCGGWIYKDKTGDAKRVGTLDALAELQRQAFFHGPNMATSTRAYGLLLLTLNVRSDDRGELPKYVQGRIAEQVHEPRLRNALRSLPVRGQEHWFLRYYVMHNVLEKLRTRGFNVYVFPPFWYRSQRSTLVHFSFMYGMDRSIVGAGQVVQPLDTLLRLPMVTFAFVGKKCRIAQVSEPQDLVSNLARFHELQRYIEEAVSLQRRGML